jgi:asparagine synthase (glutamine-hydrolysing)
MCGIAGVIRSDGGSVLQEHLDVLTSRLAHRGPDGQKTWLSDDGGCGFVHLRLAILDTERRSDQPMPDDDGRYVIVFNGEIYNFLELRTELEAAGCVFRTESDTEVLLKGWRVWGRDMLGRLNGMFAFAIRDNSSGDVFFARDRFGVKPLLYAVEGEVLAFASEQAPLLALPFVSKAIDVDVMERLLFDPFTVEASERTIFSSVRRLPGGHCAVLRRGVLSVERWWRTIDHLVVPPSDMADAAATFRDLFLDSTRLRMRSDVRIGTCLSGGFDSTAIVSAMAYVADHADGDSRRRSEDWRHAFIASFPGIAHDETPEALLAAEHASATPHRLDLSQDAGPADVEAVLEALDDVYISLPTAVWKLYRYVREEGVRVSLDGHGADEMIGAYRPTGGGFGFLLRQWLGVGGAGRGKAALDLTDGLRFFGLRLAGDSFLRRMTPPRRLAVAAMSDPLPADWGPMNRRLYGMFHATILPTLLRNFDRLSMAHGIEVRMPFMDWRLVVFAMSLPDAMKSNDKLSKLVAREAMRGIMPDSIRASPRKVGFNSQMPDWLNGELGHWALGVVERTGHPAFDQAVDRDALIARIRSLNETSGWDWFRVGRIWPYINLKWALDRLEGQDRVAPRPHGGAA